MTQDYQIKKLKIQRNIANLTYCLPPQIHDCLHLYRKKNNRKLSLKAIPNKWALPNYENKRQ